MNAGAVRQFGLSISPQFDRRSLPFYAMLGGSFALGDIALRLSGVNVSSAINSDQIIWAVLLIFVAAMLRRATRERVSTAIETMALMIPMSAALLAVQFAVSTVHRPLIDDILLRADNAFGFDWLTFARLFSAPNSLSFLTLAYFSMSKQAAILIIFFAWSGQTTRCWQFVTAAFIFFIVATVSFPLFMADGRYVLCGLRPADILIVGRLCDYGPILHQLQDGSLRVLEPSMVVGMVTFPSAHASAGLALTWFAWPNKWLRWPILVLNIALCVGAIVIGSHYMVDILGGLVVGVIAIALAKSFVRDRASE